MIIKSFLLLIFLLTILATSIAQTETEESLTFLDIEQKAISDRPLLDVAIVKQTPQKLSAQSIISCFTNPEEVITSRANGLMITPKSSILIKRDNNYRFSNGESTNNSASFAQINCDLEKSKKQKWKNLSKQSIKRGKRITRLMITSPQNAKRLSVHEIDIYCVKSVEDLDKNTFTGIGMTSGSEIITFLDPIERIQDKISSKNINRLEIIKCE